MRPIAVPAAALALAAALAAPPPAAACSCVEPGPPAAEAVRADAVFAGEVVGVEPVARQGLPRLRVTFALTAVWKGVPEGDTVSVHTARDSSTCGYPFELGERYLVYAHATPDGLATGICSRTRRESAAAPDRAALGPPTRAFDPPPEDTETPDSPG